jgi:hypothetical protein
MSKLNGHPNAEPFLMEVSLRDTDAVVVKTEAGKIQINGNMANALIELRRINEPGEMAEDLREGLLNILEFKAVFLEGEDLFITADFSYSVRKFISVLDSWAEQTKPQPDEKVQ